MNWIQSLTRAIEYIEGNLTKDITVDAVARHAYSSSPHFQSMFHIVMGLTVGEYIRNRRLSRAGQDLLRGDSRVIDVAMRYQYDSAEAFSKAFSRFHGLAPSRAMPGRLRLFQPLTVSIEVKGGFELQQNLIEDFYWDSSAAEGFEGLGPEEAYKKIADWASKARGRNPAVFDSLTEWILDDCQWTTDSLAENEEIFMHGVLARFKRQNDRLRTRLSGLRPSGVVNPAVFRALDGFDAELSGLSHADDIRGVVARVFSDFSAMLEREVRQAIAGEKTGPTGTDGVTRFGYVNYLKDCDARVQWALFMPAVVKSQQEGFKIRSFEYLNLPAMRFIGREGEEYSEPEARRGLFAALDEMLGYASGFDHDVLFMHHYGLSVDVGAWHGLWGRFMREDAPVPKGFLSFDFSPKDDGKAGPPYLSQCAYATFAGDLNAMHRREGYDVDAMYDLTRNTMLGAGWDIPYPYKYWTAEVFLQGHDRASTAYMFCTEGPKPPPAT